MPHLSASGLNPKNGVSVALNSTLGEAEKIVHSLPLSDRIIGEAGTPLIKRYREQGIRQIRKWYERHLSGKLFPSFKKSFVKSLHTREARGVPQKMGFHCGSRLFRGACALPEGGQRNPPSQTS
jgi:hypothetical protein